MGQSIYMIYLKFFPLVFLPRLSHLFIHSFFCLFISVWVNEYTFYTLHYNPIVLYFLYQIIPALTMGSSFSRLLSPFDRPPIIVGLALVNVVGLALPYSLARQEATGSSSVFPALVLGSIVSPRCPRSFYWRAALKITV